MVTLQLVLLVTLPLLTLPGVVTFEMGKLLFGARQKEPLELAQLEDVLIKIIPGYHTIIIPLGDWSKENLKFLCNGKLWVCLFHLCWPTLLEKKEGRLIIYNAFKLNLSHLHTGWLQHY